jgi:RNA polymerase sigma-70 factor, ECF subfamily
MMDAEVRGETAAVYAVHRHRLRRLVARRVPDAAAVDDIVHDVFVKFALACGSIRSIDRIGGWLNRVAANAVADYYRAQRPTAPLPDDLPAITPQRDLHLEVAACLRPLIAALPPKYRDALIWSELEGLTQREVAQRLGLSLPGAKSRVQRGRMRLRKRVLECFDIERDGDSIVACRSRDPACRCGPDADSRSP